jgi:hypothetical protein
MAFKMATKIENKSLGSHKTVEIEVFVLDDGRIQFLRNTFFWRAKVCWPLLSKGTENGTDSDSGGPKLTYPTEPKLTDQSYPIVL